MHQWGTRGQKGAAIVETAIIMPLVLMMLLGAIEFGYKIGQMNEVRHAAREAARFAAVSNVRLDLTADGKITNDDVVLAACNALNLPGALVSVSATQSGSLIGDTATVTVRAQVEAISGAPMISGFLPTELESQATFRLEQPAKWSNFSYQPCP